jgi:type I restriction enzyme R subunit
VVEAKKREEGENITTVEGQSNRYANSVFKWVKGDHRIRFANEATDNLTRFYEFSAGTTK